MQKFVVFLALGLLFAAPALAAEPANVVICEQTALAGGATYTGAAFDVSAAEGYFTVSARQTGDGPICVTYQVSLNGLDWTVPEDSGPIIASMAAGLVVQAFEPSYAPWLRVIIANTGTAEALLTVRLAYR